MHIKKYILSLLILAITSTMVLAQPFTLKSTGAGKSFLLKIYYGTGGKGAFVQYQDQHGKIPLKIRKQVVENMVKNTGTSQISYIWDELVGGKVTGSYGLTREAEKLSAVWYRRGKDGRYFQLEHAGELQEKDPGNDKYLLHGVLISFYHTTNDGIIFTYPDGNTLTSRLPGFDHPDPLRQATIADYNFDGYDDLAFSIPDAGMGVYRTFSIFLYHPGLKRFQKLADPDDSGARCSGLCDVTLDQKNKLLFSSCRGGARWWKDVYRFSKTNKLVLQRAGK